MSDIFYDRDLEKGRTIEYWGRGSIKCVEQKEKVRMQVRVGYSVISNESYLNIFFGDMHIGSLYIDEVRGMLKEMESEIERHKQ